MFFFSFNIYYVFPPKNSLIYIHACVLYLTFQFLTEYFLYTLCIHLKCFECKLMMVDCVLCGQSHLMPTYTVDPQIMIHLNCNI